MRHRVIVLVVLASVVLAGCSGLQDTQTPTDETTGVETDEIPGVENGTLTDAGTLVQTNGATIAETGGRIRVVQSGPDVERESTLTVGSGGVSSLSTAVTSGGQSGTLDYFTNATATYVRMQSDGETQYRVVERESGALDRFNDSLETYLAAGAFTVDNDSGTDTTAVLTAEEFETPDDSGFLSDADSLRGRLVLSEYGQVQNLTMTGQVNGETVTYTYELLTPVIERVSQPAWVSDVPRGASLHPELSVDVENDSYLRMTHDGGDAVPANATLSLAANNTSGTVTFESPLDDGATRYAYFASGDGSLTLTGERPSPDATTAIDSPVSITVATDDGVTLFSGSMAWESASAGEGAASGSSSSGGGQ